MNKRVTSILLCAALICALFSGCFSVNEPNGESEPTRQATEPIPTEPSEEHIPEADLPLIDWDAAFQTEGLPAGELDFDSVAFLTPGEGGSETVLNVPKAEIEGSLPKRLPRTRYYEQFMDPAVNEELLPLIDYALFINSSGFCVPTSRLSRELVESSGDLIRATYFDTYVFSAKGVMKYDQPDGQFVFLLVSIDNFSEIRDRWRRLDGLNSANGLVNSIPAELDERGRMLYIYRWLTQTVQYYGFDDSSREYYENKSWSLLFDAMLSHCTVDIGYAETLTVICNLAGIECFTVKSESHVWNVARIDEKYYRFDAAADRGLTPADFRYCGVSDETFINFNGAGGEEALAFYREYCPQCRDDLFSPRPDAGKDTNEPISKIAEYYRLRNARNANPLLLFYQMKYKHEEICKESPKSCWIGTCVRSDALMELLCGVMTREQAARFAEGYLEAKTDDERMVAYRVPAEDPLLVRLAGAEDNGDGTWSVHLLRYRFPCEFTPYEETVSMTLINGEWFIDGAGH